MRVEDHAKHGIRRFEVADAAAMQALASTEPLVAQWSRESYGRLVECGYEAWMAITAGGEVSGFMVTRTVSVEAEILNLAVARGYRRTGIASALCDAALRDFCLVGVQRVFLEVRASNMAAIAFYEKRGFAKVGSRPGYYPGQENGAAEAAVLMEKIVTG
jgi:ribosomal-protein-alanine N-acetyltransferase